MNSADDIVEAEKYRAREPAHSPVEEAWDLGEKALKLTVEYVRVAETEG